MPALPVSWYTRLLMNKLFSTDFFIGNRSVLRKLLPDGSLVVVTAHGLLQQTADTTFPFRQDSNFWYLTGIDEPDIILVLDGLQDYLIVPGRSDSRQAFDGAIEYGDLTKVSGIVDVMSEQEGWKRLSEALKKQSTVHGLPAAPSYIEQYGMYTNPARARLVERLHTWNSQLTIEDIRGVLTNLRMVKQPAELRAIQQAINLTISGIEFVTEDEKLSSFVYEFDIESELTKRFRTTESGGHAFSPIIASGYSAVTLHNTTNNSKIPQNSLVVVDVGADVSHYAADITRTVGYGKPTPRQQDVYSAVLDVQDYALALLKPGTLLKEYEAQVETYLGGKLQELGLIKNVEREAVRKYYPHAASHFLGLDVHDVGDYSRPLQENMVVTCEPGIYIPEEDIGVRIEDDVLITPAGNRVLSAALARRLTA